MIQPRQYYLSSTPPETVADGYRSLSVGEWHLVFDDSFDSVPVVVGDDHVGHVIGTILDVQDRCEEGELRLDDANTNADADASADPDANANADAAPDTNASPDPLTAAFREALFGFAGHYLGFIEAEGPSVFTDSIGGCPVVYEPNEGVVGATPAALPGVDHRARFRSDLFDRLNYDYEYIFVPGKYTYYSGVQRLLPNHRLDLRTWETTRCWPDPESISTCDETTAVAEFVGTTLRSIFEEIVSTYEKPVTALTAGHDSRTLLAGARPWLVDGKIGTVTWDTGRPVDVDVDVARKLSAGYDFDWTPVPVVTATESEKQRWLEQTAHVVGGNIMNVHPTLETFDADLHANGFGGALARGKYWTESDEPDTSFSTSELLYRLHRSEDPVLEEAIEDWYASVSEFDAYTQLDLMFQELRLGCWAGPHFPGLSQHRDVVSPLSYYPILRALHRLAPAVRRNGTIQYVIIDRFWSELNEHPYNIYADWRDYVRKAKDLQFRTRFALHRPRLAYSFVSRKLVGK